MRLYKLSALIIGWAIVGLLAYFALIPPGQQLESGPRSGALRLSVVIPTKVIDAPHIPIFAGVQLDLFKKKGVDVEIRFVENEASAIDMVLKGEADVGLAKAVTIVKARADGKPVKAVSQIFAKNPYGIILLGETKSISFLDLAGKTIGAPAATDSIALLQLRLLLSKFNLENKVRLATLEGDPIQQLKEGSVDGVLGKLTDLPLYREALPKVSFLRFSEFGIEIPDWAVFVNEQTLSKNEDAVIGFVAALARSLKWVAQNPGGASDILASKEPALYKERRFVALDKMLLAKELIMRGDEPVTSIWGVVTREGYMAVINLLTEAGELSRSLTPEDVAALGAKRVLDACVVAD
jgi:ABC-type nitrate/sulfonate/bicarbonate transport system substrate-binding protein